jgi:hypothetical protein
VVKSKIRLKNAVLGRYADQCFMFGLIDDTEFSMWRDGFAVDCHDKKFVTNWEIRKSFQSEWNVPASTAALNAEPPRVFRRPFRLSHAAMAGCFSMA